MYYHTREVIRNHFKDLLEQCQLEEAKIHECLADWYREVFVASGSPTAAFEATFHSIESCEAYLKKGKLFYPEAITRLWWTDEILRLVAYPARIRGSAGGNVAKLERLQKRLTSMTRQRNAQNQKSDSLNVALSEVDKQCFRVMRGIDAEVGEYSRSCITNKYLLISVITKRSAAKLEIESLMKNPEQLEEQFWMLVIDGNSIRKPRSPTLDIWIRWHRWNGTLLGQSRQYENSHSAFMNILIRLSNNSHSLSNQLVDDDSNNINEQQKHKKLIEKITSLYTIDKTKRMEVASIDHEVRIELVSLLERFMRLLLLRSYVHSRRSQKLQDKDGRAEANGKASEFLDLAKCIFESACAILKRCEANDKNKPERPDDRAGRQLMRLLTLRSVISVRHVISVRRVDSVRHVDYDIAERNNENEDKSHHPQPSSLGESGGRIEAMHYLDRAEAQLNLIDPGRRSMGGALIGLHRAEVALECALSVPIKSGTFTLDKNSESYQLDWFRCFLSVARKLLVDGSKSLLSEDRANVGDATRTLIDKLNEIKKALSGSSSDQKVKFRQIALSYLSDSHLALDEAEPFLLKRRRNVWWSTWYFQRRLYAIELELWATLFATEEPIPYLGLEAAPYRTATLPDRLLSDTVRMIAKDSYRLASVVESYAYCSGALHLRLLIDGHSPRLTVRRQEMWENLENAIRRLETMRSSETQDEQSQQKQPNAQQKQPNECSVYVGLVIEECRSIQRITAHPIH